MARPGSTRSLPALVLVGVGLSVLSVPISHADTTPTARATPGRAVVTDLRPTSPERAAAAPADLDDAVAVVTSPTVAGGVRGANLALRSGGTVTGWGADLAGETRPPADLTGVVDLDLAPGFALAARTDGSVVAWGGRGSGVLDLPTDLTDVKAVAAFGAGECTFGLALRGDGTVVQWGGTSCAEGMAYQLPDGLTHVTSIAAGDDAAIALREDGTVATWGPAGNLSFLDGLRPSEWTGVTQVATQSRTFVGLTADRTTLAYGVWGEAGAPLGLADVATVSAGENPAFLLTDGSAYLWQAPVTDLPAAPYSAVVAGLGYLVTILPAVPAPTDSPQPTGPPRPTLPPTEGTPTGSPTPTALPRPTATRTVCPPRPRWTHRPWFHHPRPAPTAPGTRATPPPTA